MKLENGFWTDENNNKWDCKFFTEKQAEQLSLTMVNCNDCIDCSHCNRCTNCSGSGGCSYCRNLINCDYCIYCNDCKNCSYCNDCGKCKDCMNCRDCRSCKNCMNCMNCSSCRYCIVCSDCRKCRNCTNCSDCDDFPENPQRIVGKKIGSRNESIVVYWNEIGKEQCVVGCFHGTLLELEKKVKEVHKDNPKHYDDYMKFIENCRKYQELTVGK